MTSIQLTLKNMGPEDLTDIKISSSKNFPPEMTIHEFPAISNLPAGAVSSSQNATIGIDFNDSTNVASLYLVASGRTFPVQIQPNVGELVRPVSISEATFDQERAKLRGMNEVEASVELPPAHADDASVKKRVYEAANVLQVPSIDSSLLRFAGLTNSNNYVILLTIEKGQKIIVNCEKMVMSSMLLKEIKTALMHQ